MKKSLSGVIIGLLFVLLGVSLALKAFGYDFEIFFDGWWALFIIIPSFAGLFERRDRTSSLIGLGVGVLLLLSAQDIITWQMFGKLIVSFIFLMIGLSMVFRKSYTSHEFKGESVTGTPEFKNYSAFFGGRNIRYDNQEFKGANISVVCGGIDLNLRNAIINSDVIIEASIALGGMDIFVPNNVNVEIDCTPILGGVDNKTVTPISSEGKPTPTIYIKATCILGGIDVK